MNSLTLLVSYPKSGNTWIRAILTSIANAGDQLDINKIAIPNAADRLFCNRYLGVNSTEFTPEELARIRPQIFSCYVNATDRPRYLKVHDAFLSPRPSGCFPFHEQDIDSVVYIVRDPRDVAISFANHMGIPLDDTISLMARKNFTLAIARRSALMQLPQLISSWSIHVESWVRKSPFRMHLLRYEDLLADPWNVVSNMMEFLAVDVSPEVIKRAIAATEFKVLKRHELENGFVERWPASAQFFRAGIAGSWKKLLTEEQIRQIESGHGNMMQWLGYRLA